LVKIVRVFTEDQQPYTDLFEAVDDWQEQFIKATEMGMAPRVLSAPIFLLWEITSRCPQNCIYCYNESPRKVQELSSRRLFQVADQIIEAGLFNMCLSGGEPTMREEYFDLLQYLATSGVQMGTVLSGWRIDKKAARHIARFASTVQISLDGSTSEIHDAVRQRKGSYDDAVRAIRHFVDLGIPVHISFAVTRYTIGDFPNMYNLCEELGVATLRTQKLAVSGKVKGHSDDICAGDDGYESLNQFRQTVQEDKGKKLRIAYDDPTKHITFGSRFGFVVLARITAEGYLGLSPYLNIFFGDLKTEDLGDIWSRMCYGWHHPQVQEILQTQVKCEDEIIFDSMPESVFIA